MKPDGVYNPSTTEAIKALTTGPAVADQNIFDWYLANVPSLKGHQVVDWGAGIGRFVPFFRYREAEHITLIEPSDSALQSLMEAFASASDITVVRGGIESKVPRGDTSTPRTHFCTFVVNCCDSIGKAFSGLRAAIIPGERLFVVTNVFAPSRLVDSIASPQASNSVTLNVADLAASNTRPPTATTFANRILATGDILTDSVHTLYEFAPPLLEGFSVRKLELMLPDGFEHILRANEPAGAFSDYKFAVLTIELERS